MRLRVSFRGKPRCSNPEDFLQAGLERLHKTKQKSRRFVSLKDYYNRLFLISSIVRSFSISNCSSLVNVFCKLVGVDSLNIFIFDNFIAYYFREVVVNSLV